MSEASEFLAKASERLECVSLDDAANIVRNIEIERDRYKAEAGRLREGWLNSVCLGYPTELCEHWLDTQDKCHGYGSGDYCQAVLDAVDKGAQ